MKKNYGAEIDELMDRLEQLRIEYEKYFIGVETRQPAQMRREVESRVRRFLGSQKILKSAEKMKQENLRSRFVSYQHYWERTLREIENGTYRRHVRMAAEREKLAREIEQRYGKKPNEEEKRPSLAGQSADGSFDLSAGIDSGVAPEPKSQIDSVYEQYQKAGARVNKDKLESLLKKQEAAIKQKYGAQNVEFSVKVVDGKPKLSAKPIK